MIGGRTNSEEIEAPASTLRVQIEGAPRSVSLESFVTVLHETHLMLRDTDKVMTGRVGGILEWLVLDLHSVEGLTAVLGSRLRPRARADERAAKEVTAAYVEALNIAQEGDVLPPNVSEAGLDHLVRMSRWLSRNGAKGVSTEYLEGEQWAHVGPQVAANVGKLRVSRLKALGSIIGRLEEVSVHRRHRYVVYDEATKRPVRCEFPGGQLSDVKDALGHRVRVRGEVYRNSKGQPLRVEEPTFEWLTPEAELPTVDDLVGSDPGFTGILTTSEHLDKLRDG